MLRATSLILHGSDPRHADKLGGQYFPADRQSMKFLYCFQIGRATAFIFSLGLSFFSAFLKSFFVVKARARRVGGSLC